MSPAPRWGYTGLILGVSVALGIWILHGAGWLAAWDGIFYDRIHAWTTGWREPKPKVLLVRLAREDAWSGPEAVKTLELLEGLGARAIAFESIPLRNSLEFFERAAAMKNVVFGRELRPDPNNPEMQRLEPWTAAARELDLPWGVVFLPPGVKGVHRSQQTSVRAGTNDWPTLESRLAALCEPPSVSRAGNGAFLVSFMDGTGRIPNVELSKLLAGELIPELVRGKVVLVGFGDSVVGVDTPVSGGTEAMSFLEFQGNALETLLEERPIRPLPMGPMLLLLLSLSMGSAVLYQRVSSLAGVRLALGVLLVCTGMVVAGLVFFRCWIPLGPLVLAQGAQFALTLVYKTRTSHLALSELRLRALSQMKARGCLPDIFASAEYWDYLASMVNQTLDVSRMVFLERIPQTPQLREAKAFNCTFEEVQEKERSLDASVFAEAVATSHPIRKENIFAPKPEVEDEYLCPLAFAGERLGIWVVGIEPGKAAAIPQFEQTLSRLSEQIARLLYRRDLSAVRPSLGARLKRWISVEKGDQTYLELSGTAELLEQYYDVLEAVFDQVGTATMVYDCFGRVLKASDQALALLQAESFVPTKGTALELLRLLTGTDDSQARHLLRDVLLDRSPTSLTVNLPSQAERQFLLRLYPLLGRKEAHSGPELFIAQGIVCELIDTTSLSNLARLKGLVAERLGVELRDHLAAIEMSAALLEAEELAPAERQSVLDVIHYKTDMCVHVISECQKYLGREAEAQTTHCFPVDALEVLDEVCSEFAHKAAERQVTLERDQPRLTAQVLAATANLERLFSTTLELLLGDAAEGTALTIRVDDASSLAIFHFSNCGFGIPNERLQEILTSPEVPDSKEFQVLRQAAVWVRDWGGSLDIQSEVGKGYSLTLQLRQFQLSALLRTNPA